MLRSGAHPHSVSRCPIAPYKDIKPAGVLQKKGLNRPTNACRSVNAAVQCQAVTAVVPGKHCNLSIIDIKTRSMDIQVHFCCPVPAFAICTLGGVHARLA